jgi:hypothetical protein
MPMAKSERGYDVTAEGCYQRKLLDQYETPACATLL